MDDARFGAEAGEGAAAAGPEPLSPPGPRLGAEPSMSSLLLLIFPQNPSGRARPETLTTAGVCAPEGATSDEASPGGGGVNVGVAGSAEAGISLKGAFADTAAAS